MIISGTGHRPDKLEMGGPKYSYDQHIKLVTLLRPCIRRLQPTKIISGMALGFDQAWAMAAFYVGVPFIAAIPCEGQESEWPKESQKNYHSILKNASEIVIVNKQKFDNFCMQKRNMWMVDNSDKLLALWDGSKGGTGNCVEYAKKKKKEILNVWDAWMIHCEEDFKA